MIRILVVSWLLATPGLARASDYHCSASLSHVPSVVWNGGYFIHVREGMRDRTFVEVRLTRYLTSGLPHSERIRLECQAGSSGAEYDCVERFTGVNREEILAAQFYANGWVTLFASPVESWRPFVISHVPCNRLHGFCASNSCWRTNWFWKHRHGVR